MIKEWIITWLSKEFLKPSCSQAATTGPTGPEGLCDGFTLRGWGNPRYSGHQALICKKEYKNKWMPANPQPGLPTGSFSKIAYISGYLGISMVSHSPMGTHMKFTFDMLSGLGEIPGEISISPFLSLSLSQLKLKNHVGVQMRVMSYLFLF